MADWHDKKRRSLGHRACQDHGEVTAQDAVLCGCCVSCLAAQHGSGSVAAHQDRKLLKQLRVEQSWLRALEEQKDSSSLVIPSARGCNHKWCMFDAAYVWAVSGLSVFLNPERRNPLNRTQHRKNNCQVNDRASFTSNISSDASRKASRYAWEAKAVSRCSSWGCDVPATSA